MKIKAKEVKVGMTVVWGAETITVTKIEESFQKNGKKIMILYGGGTYSYGGGYKEALLPSHYITPKAETFLRLK